MSKWSNFRIKHGDAVYDGRYDPNYQAYRAFWERLGIAYAAYPVWYQLSKGGW